MFLRQLAEISWSWSTQITTAKTEIKIKLNRNVQNVEKW